jgi:hypothetical protein
MAHAPLKMTIEQAAAETRAAWTASYSPERNAEVVEALRDRHIRYRLSHLMARFFFRGIYFPQMSKWAWVKLIAQNRKPMLGLLREAVSSYRAARRKRAELQREKKAELQSRDARPLADK